MVVISVRVRPAIAARLERAAAAAHLSVSEYVRRQLERGVELEDFGTVLQTALAQQTVRLTEAVRTLLEEYAQSPAPPPSEESLSW